MNLHQLEDVLRQAYSDRDPSERWDTVERVVRHAQELRAQLGDEAEGVDPDVLLLLAALGLVRDDLKRDIALRGRVEAFVVEEGWTNLQLRELFKHVEALDKPKNLEEQIVADALTLVELGALGVARGLMSAGHRGLTLPDALQQMRRRLTARLYTRPAQSRLKAGKDELRALLEQLSRSV